MQGGRTGARAAWTGPRTTAQPPPAPADARGGHVAQWAGQKTGVISSSTGQTPPWHCPQNHRKVEHLLFPPFEAQGYLPQRVFLLGEDLEVFLCQLHGRQRLQLQVGPGVEEADQVLEGVQAQAVVAVIGQMGHEDADLKRKGQRRG